MGDRTLDVIRLGRKQNTLVCLFLIVGGALVFLFSGCVHVAGTAGYWRTNEEDSQAKQVGFDTAKLVPSNNRGRITI